MRTIVDPQTQQRFVVVKNRSQAQRIAREIAGPRARLWLRDGGLQVGVEDSSGNKQIFHGVEDGDFADLLRPLIHAVLPDLIVVSRSSKA